VPTRRWPRHHRARTWGIIFLILGTVHAPLPEADFHNVRHHDTPGEVCEHHDHLLRWHPDAGAADDVAILHWHWVLPTSRPVEPGHSGSGLLLHAYVDGWDLASPESGPSFVPDSASRPLSPPLARPLTSFDLAILAPPAGGDDPRSGREPAQGREGTLARRVSLVAWLHRWTC